MIFIEDQHTELKENARGENITKEIVSFLNTCNGKIIIGVKDNGAILGVDNIDETSLYISNVILDQIEPQARELVSIDTPTYGGKQIIEISIKKGPKFYYIKKHGLSSAGCYERIGTSCRSMSPEQISKRFMKTLTIPEKTIVNTPCNRTHLTFSKFKLYLSAKNIHYSIKFFNENFNLLTPDGKYNILADLLSDENSVSIKVAIFKGKTKANYLKRNEYGFTNILYGLDQVCDYCLALDETYVDTSTLVRKEIKLFDEDAFREAWINAVVHNKWVDGIPPAVYWFSDRLEIISYGKIPDGMSKKEFLEGKSNPVNKDLMNLFLKCGIVEQSGHGVPKVVEKYGSGAFKFGTSTISVIIPFNLDGFKREKGVINERKNIEQKTRENGIKKDNEEDAIIKAIVNDCNITIKELSIVTGKSKRTIYRIIKKSQKIKRVGPNKNGYWVVND